VKWLLVSKKPFMLLSAIVVTLLGIEGGINLTDIWRTIITIALSVICVLLGVVYRDLMRRLKQLESNVNELRRKRG